MRTNARDILAPYIWVPKSLGGLVARALFTAVRRARTTASARALDRATRRHMAMWNFYPTKNSGGKGGCVKFTIYGLYSQNLYRPGFFLFDIFL